MLINLSNRLRISLNTLFASSLMLTKKQNFDIHQKVYVYTYTRILHAKGKFANEFVNAICT